MKRHHFFRFSLATVVTLLAGCSAPAYTGLAENYAHPPQPDNYPDYNQLYYWAAHPALHDPSDSTPAAYRHFSKDSSVDVFFLHPTTYTRDKDVEGKPYTMQYWNAAINDAALNAKTDYTAILNQASVFNQYRVFAPRYRQAHIHSFFIADSIAKPFFDTAYSDVKAAFHFYLQHYNHGRPFILAAHSQGTRHAARLLKEEVEGTPLVKQLVAAYITGLPVRRDYFAHLPPCNAPDQLGCIVSWRTVKKGYLPELVKKETFETININPLTFSAQVPRAGRDSNKGTILWDFENPKPRNVGAEVHGNVLWSTKPRFFGSFLFWNRNYHIGDINLFWKNVRDNVQVRVNAYKAGNQELGIGN
jgi:Protein of unknown function (DUF3089)